MKKNFIFLFTILFNTLAVFALTSNESNQSWRVLQRAEQEFENNNFSAAMRLAQDAVSIHRKESEDAGFILTNALKPYQVRKTGDDINEVLTVLKERQEYDAINIITDLTDKLGYDFFHNSIKEITSYIQKRKDYPEAYFLIGKIYRIEGEFNMALDFLEKARATASLLEVPAELNDILFLIADIADYIKDIPLQEKALILIAQNSSDYTNETLKNAIIRTSKSTKEDNSSRFFKLYRVDSVSSVKAYFTLSKIYLENKKYQEAYISNIYGVLICFTHLNSILEERESEYEYKDLPSFFKELCRYPDIIQWCSSVGFWEGFYNITDFGFKCGYSRFAKDIITVLSKTCPDEYWKKASAHRLSELETVTQ